MLGANAVLMDAYNTDVRPLLADLREDMGLDPDPIAAYRRSGYASASRTERGRRARKPGGEPDPTTSTDRVSGPRHARVEPARVPTRATPTTPAATPRPRATATDPVTGSRSSCCGSRAPAATSAR